MFNKKQFLIGLRFWFNSLDIYDAVYSHFGSKQFQLKCSHGRESIIN